MKPTKEPRRFKKRRRNGKREYCLQPICFAATNLVGGETLCQNEYW